MKFSGEKLRDLREDAGMSQSELARRVAAIGPEISASSINAYEQDEVLSPSHLRVMAMARILGVQSDALFVE